MLELNQVILLNFQVKKNDFVEFSLENKLLDITGVSLEFHIWKKYHRRKLEKKKKKKNNKDENTQG